MSSHISAAAPDIPLSEKAKGKRPEVVENPVSPSESDQTAREATSTPLALKSIYQRQFTIRFSDGSADLLMSVGKKDTVRNVIKHIRTTRQSTRQRRLRLIHSGRLLTPGTFLFSWLQTLEERQANAVSELEGRLGFGLTSPFQSTEPPRARVSLEHDSAKQLEVVGSYSDLLLPDNTSLPPESARKPDVWFHCSVGPQLAESELEAEEEHVQTSQLRPLRGFDRLEAAGFTSDEIENVRRQFHSARGQIEEEPPALSGALDEPNEEDADEHARALEEQWIDSVGQQPNFPSSDNPFNIDPAAESATGYYTPLLHAFWSDEYIDLWEEDSEEAGTRNILFPRRLLMAVCFGFITNVAYGLLRYLTV